MAGNKPTNKSNETQDRQLAGVKMPPHSLEAEQSVLGGLMLDNERWDNVSERVVANDFFNRSHRLIFSEMQRLLENSKPIDLITLSESLETRGELEMAGGFAYLGQHLAAVLVGAPSQPCHGVGDGCISARKASYQRE